jgi:transposase
MIQDGKLRGFAMGQAIAVRTDYTAGEVRRFAQRAKDAAQARRLLAIAAVLDGASREEAAKIGGMDRQTLRDWVIRFNEQGADGLINIPSPGMPPKLNAIHKTFLARIVEEGPIPAIHGVVRWRACDLIMRLHEEFGLSVSDDTIYRALKNAARTRTQRPRKYLAIHAAELAVEPNFQILRRYRRPLLLRLEHAHRPALEDHVHRPTRLGSSRSLKLRIGINR